MKPLLGLMLAAVSMVNSYPEFRVDGKPFFVHSAAFFYYRTPPDRWEPFLRRYRDLGINTIDLYVPWNWHEPVEGKLDLTSAARVIHVAGGLGLKVILRPGPVMLNEWRNGGYPDWLLRRPEYNMPLLDVLEGRYPPLSNLAPAKSDEASRGWLDNPTHMRYARAYIQAVARELIVPNRQTILAVQLDDDQALNRSNYNGAFFWKYMQTIRGWLAEGGNDRPVFINPTDMRVSAAGFGERPPIYAMGQWYQQAIPGDNLPLSDAEYRELQFFASTLATQPGFPAMLIEFQAGWYCPPDDLAPRASHPANTLLASRFLWASGLRGINYFPLQDTVTPPGYEVPWTNRHYAWTAPLDTDGNEQAKAMAIRRNGAFIRGMGSRLAATDTWADAAIVYALGAYPQEELSAADIKRISNETIQWQAELRAKSVTVDLVDPQYQTAEQLRRYPVLLLKRDAKYKLSERAESVLRESGVRILDQMPDAPRVVEASGGVQASAALANNGRSAFLFVANPDYQQSRTTRITVRDPRDASKTIALPEFTLPPHESLILPIRQPLCDSCGDEVVWSTAELTSTSMQWYTAQQAQALIVRRGQARTIEIPTSAAPAPLAKLPPIPAEKGEVLDNGRLRVVFTPNAGGRAFTIERKGTNATTPIGFFRDKFTKYDDTGRNPMRRRGAWGLHNRPYQLTRLPNAVRMEYTAPDVLPSGVRISKQFTLPPGKDYLLAEYEFSGDIQAKSASRFAGNDTQGFISMNSVPVVASESGPDWLATHIKEDVLVLSWFRKGNGAATPKSLSSLWNIEFASLGSVRMALWFGPGEVATIVEELKRVLAETHP